MSKARCRELAEIGDRLFSQRGSLMSHWQDIAEHFYPSRADFTTTRVLGDDFAGHLMTGYPALQLRELADQLAAMLRPSQKVWAKLSASDEAINDDDAAKAWLEDRSERMRKYMYASGAKFLRATKTGDKDFVAFGNAVIQVRLNSTLDGLLYISRHLRDVAWAENADCKIDTLHRKEKVPARTLCYAFPKTVAKEVERIKDKEPYREFEVRHIVVPSDQYGGERKNINKDKFPWVSIYIDKDNDTILEELPQRRFGYVIPRWDMGALGVYAASPATMLGLPDSRLLQQMTVALLEAGEKAVNPPVVATSEVVRSDLQMFANGLSWIDKEYDERLGDAIRTLNPDIAGIQFGLTMLADTREQLKQIFYLNKINLPEFGKDMTAFETQQRVAEYVRSALPLFEPMETEYNGAICEETFELLRDNGAFGSPDEMPDILSDADVRFEFESPLQAAAERANVVAFQEAAGLLEMAAKIDPASINEVDVRAALRDAIDGVGAPAKWRRPKEQVAELDQQAAELRAQQQAMQEVAQGAGVADQAGSAMKQMAEAGMV